MISLDSELWPVVGVVAVLVIALLARWLRGMAVEDPQKTLADLAPNGPMPAMEEMHGADSYDDEEPPEDDADMDDADDDTAEDTDDELAPLGVSPDDRSEFLAGIAEHGAIALLFSPPDDPTRPASVVQHYRDDGSSTMPVFTSDRKSTR